MEDHNQYGTISMNFAPNITFLNRIALRYTDLRPVKLYTSTLNDITTRITKPKYLIKFFPLKAIKAMIKKGGLAGASGADRGGQEEAGDFLWGRAHARYRKAPRREVRPPSGQDDVA